MNEVLDFISDMKVEMENIIIENNMKSLGNNINDIFSVYCADFCKVLNQKYPGATIMMHKFYRNCGVMISGVVYTPCGIVNRYDYHVAENEEMNFIKKSFKHLPDEIMCDLITRLFKDTENYQIALKE